MLIEIFNRRLGFYEKISGTYFSDIQAFINVCFIFNFADDFFKHILNGHQSGNTSILIDHNRHVVAVLSEFSK